MKKFITVALIAMVVLCSSFAAVDAGKLAIAQDVTLTTLVDYHLPKGAGETVRTADVTVAPTIGFAATYDVTDDASVKVKADFVFTVADYSGERDPLNLFWAGDGGKTPTVTGFDVYAGYCTKKDFDVLNKTANAIVSAGLKFKRVGGRNLFGPASDITVKFPLPVSNNAKITEAYFGITASGAYYIVDSKNAKTGNVTFTTEQGIGAGFALHF